MHPNKIIILKKNIKPFQEFYGYKISPASTSVRGDAYQPSFPVHTCLLWQQAERSYQMLGPDVTSCQATAEAVAPVQTLTTSGWTFSCCLLGSTACRTTRVWRKKPAWFFSPIRLLQLPGIILGVSHCIKTRTHVHWDKRPMLSHPSWTTATMPSTFKLPCRSTQKFGLLPATWLADGSSSSSSVAPAPTSSMSESIEFSK